MMTDSDTNGAGTPPFGRNLSSWNAQLDTPIDVAPGVPVTFAINWKLYWLIDKEIGLGTEANNLVASLTNAHRALFITELFDV